MYKLNILLSFYYFAIVTVFANTSAVNDSFCIIHEPVLSLFSYNFTNLISSTKDVILNFLNITIRLQLCSPLKEKCNGKDGYGVCLLQNKEEKGIGKMPPIVNITQGRISFIFTGDDCTSKLKYTVNIIMKCDYEAENSYPDIFPNTLKTCNIFMIWKTHLACGPRIKKNCTVINNGLHYDLSPLISYSQNYIILMDNKTSSKIILNVCHSVIFEYNALCQSTSGACLQNLSQIGYVNLGDVQSPTITDGKLMLEYQDGDLCKVKNITIPHIKTTISFICDFEAKDTFPEYIGGSEECHYQIIWKTRAACSIEFLRNSSIATAGKCTVNNPLTNFTYDLRSLMNKNFTITKNDIQYKFKICESLVDNSCVTGTGICLSNKNKSMGISMGKANTNLIWEEGGPYLNYTDGDLCENEQRHYTIIAFFCGPEGSPDKPLIMEQNTCQLIIHWNTNLVCEQRSLGLSKESPMLNKNHETVLHYVDGSICPENSNKLISSNFTFPCYNNDKGLPEFKKYEDCTYIFEWKTSITCGAAMGNWISPCIVKDQLFSHECNLSLLHKNEKVYYVKNKQGKEYSINICGGEKVCDSSAICQGNNEYGSLVNVIFDYGRNVIKLQYSNGSKCVNGFYTSEVWFICNKSIGIGTPKLLWESECSAKFEWYTNVTCACQSNSQQVTIPSKYIVQNFSPSHTGVVAVIVLSVIALIIALFYFRNPDKRACLRSCINPFSSRRGNSRVQYCRVDTTEEARLLLDVDATQCQTDSDDDLLNA
ncbi:cation-independent mannose-6-phosphate receptor isoform X2 [Apis laboriosa]|uniref:cation-independent mannose-6-phosphate receptor isoform X2 n=1 Tax=Apis laboriosa TaxID=183418 RepID=UPI001CC50A09|nr:cation-independent mannose-6-phosphate receptor isoform X2 [Apis laboriosa]